MALPLPPPPPRVFPGGARAWLRGRRTEPSRPAASPRRCPARPLPGCPCLSPRPARPSKRRVAARPLLRVARAAYLPGGAAPPGPLPAREPRVGRRRSCPPLQGRRVLPPPPPCLERPGALPHPRGSSCHGGRSGSVSAPRGPFPRFPSASSSSIQSPTLLMPTQPAPPKAGAIPVPDDAGAASVGPSSLRASRPAAPSTRSNRPRLEPGDPTAHKCRRRESRGEAPPPISPVQGGPPPKEAPLNGGGGGVCVCVCVVDSGREERRF